MIHFTVPTKKPMFIRLVSFNSYDENMHIQLPNLLCWHWTPLYIWARINSIRQELISDPPLKTVQVRKTQGRTYLQTCRLLGGLCRYGDKKAENYHELQQETEMLLAVSVGFFSRPGCFEPQFRRFLRPLSKRGGEEHSPRLQPYKNLVKPPKSHTFIQNNNVCLIKLVLLLVWISHGKIFFKIYICLLVFHFISLFL